MEMEDDGSFEQPVNPEALIDNSHLVTFKSFCNFLEKVQDAPKKDVRSRRLETFISKWRREVKGTMYPALRLLMPNVDRGRLYNMKEVMLGRSYLEVMGIPKDSEDGQALVKFNLPGKSTKAAGDFPRVLYEIVRSRSTVTESKVSIKKINEMLDNFARDHDKSEQRPIIREWVETLTAEEHMWLAKIILKQMKLGVSEQTILEAFHPDARELFTVNADLRTLCEKLYSVSFRLNNTSISVATAFKPQLSKMGNYTTLTHIDEWMGQLGCKEFWIETKLDGERMQIHIDNGQWRYYSRKGTNYTQDYGPDPTRGSLTPFIHNSINAHVKRCILDGELVVYDPASDALVPFGNLKTVGRKSFNPMNEHEPHPYFVAFDILQMDNVSLAEKPLHRRYEVLQSIIDPIPGRIAIIDQLRGTSSAQALHAFHAAIEAGQEGIIVKNPESRYVPNSRTMDWTKVKAEYVEGVSEHPDVVVVGGYYGTGNRANKISKFLVAIRDTPKQDEVVDPERPKLLTFARVGSGASYKELDAMTQRFPWKRFDDKRVPSWLAIGKEKPEMILDPYTKVDGVDSAIVLELKAAEITPADDYSCGYSLRFPRIMKIRTDKPVTDIWDMDLVQKYRDEYKGMLAAGKPRVDGEGVLGKRKRGGDSSTFQRQFQAPVKVAEAFQRADMTGVEPIQEEPLNGKEVCVMRSGDDSRKHELERMAHALGARVVQNPGQSTSCVVADNRETAKVINQIKQGTHDIIVSQWLVDVFNMKDAIQPEWNQYIYMTDDTREQLLETHDKYGDPYTRDMTGTELLQYMKKMDVSKELDKWRQTDEAVGFEELGQSGLIYKPPRIKRLIKEINERYFQEQPPLSCLFLNVIAWFDVPGALEVDLVANAEVAAVGTQDLTERERERIKERSEETSLHDAASLLRFYGGQPVEKLYHNVTHVIVDSGEMSQLSRLRKIMASRLPVTFRIVTQDWILDSINRSERAPEEQYFPR